MIHAALLLILLDVLASLGPVGAPVGSEAQRVVHSDDITEGLPCTQRQDNKKVSDGSWSHMAATLLLGDPKVFPFHHPKK